MRNALATELADTWELHADSDTTPGQYGKGRRETLRQCADTIRMLMDSERLTAQPVPPPVTRAWQPIATAPRDNKRPLYLARFNEQGELAELAFNGAWEYWQESWEMAHINGYAWVSDGGIEEVTHWAYQDEGPPPASSPETPK